MISKGSSFFPEGTVEGSFWLKSFHLHQHSFLISLPRPNSSSRLLGNLSIFPTTSSICESFRVCFPCQIEKPLENQEREKETYFPPSPVLSLHNSLDKRDSYWRGSMSKVSLHCSAHNLRVWRQLGLTLGLFCIPHSGRPTGAGTLFAIEYEGKESGVLASLWIQYKPAAWFRCWPCQCFIRWMILIYTRSQVLQGAAQVVLRSWVWFKNPHFWRTPASLGLGMKMIFKTGNNLRRITLSSAREIVIGFIGFSYSE